MASVSLGAGAAQAAVVYCKTVGVVGVGAPGVVVRPGEPLNRGGPVDRIGRR